MSAASRKIGISVVVALGLLVAVLPVVPAADAAVAPWTWKRVTQNVSVQPTTSYAIRATCPTGFTAITGGLQLPNFSTVVTLGQYRQDDATGSGWSVIFRNNSTSTGTATVVAECVETADLPPTSYHVLEFARDGNGSAAGTVSCLNPGELVLTGGADWSGGGNERRVFASAPAWSGEAWYASGYSNVTGAKLYIDVYCVHPSYMPGYERVEAVAGTGWAVSTATCPVGKRILNGGPDGFAYGSAPSLNSWVTTSSGSRTTRAMCIDAGTPTVFLAIATPGASGSVYASSSAFFSMSGSDPAGFPNAFRCSLDGAPPTSCTSGVSYSGLANGPHQFIVSNVTADGRSSGLIVYQWTVDTVAPTVSTPTLPVATLNASALAKWTGSDQHSAVDHYQAAYDLIHADGTSTGWTYPAEWADLGTSVRTPDLAAGETVCVSVRAYDQASNVSPWSTPACTTRPLDDRALTASAGWTRATGSAYWLNTVSRTTASGQTLSRSNVTLNRVGILATQCPGCGAVVVKVGDSKIGRINLDRATLANRKVRLLPAFGNQTGVVTIRSVTTSQQIAIDGLVAIQAVTAGPA